MDHLLHSDRRRSCESIIGHNEEEPPRDPLERHHRHAECIGASIFWSGFR